MCVGKSSSVMTTHRITYNFRFMIVILLLKFNYFELSESAKQHDYSYNSGGNASMGLLRFHDFEPRYTGKSDRSPDSLAHSLEIQNIKDAKQRQGRGFHFSATGEDISVELEFIVPFFQIPVKRSVSLARNAFQGVLNLQAGALVNTFVIVVAAGSIALLIKLLTATLAVGTPSTIYGHGYKQTKSDEVDEDTTLARSVRSLTTAFENILSEHNFNITACIQRDLCGYLRNQYEIDIGYNKFIKTLLSTQYTNSFIRDTAIHHSIQSAKATQGCDLIYHNCRWPHWNTKILNIINHYLKIYNG